MELIETADYDDLSRRAADMVQHVIQRKPDAAILLATGNTPMGMYAELANRHVHGELDCSRLRVFQLDDYVGIPRSDPRSLYGWMRRAALDPLGISDERVVPLDTDEEGAAERCRAYDAEVEAVGGLDLTILGLGPNGHLGFNEPPSGPDESTRVVDLRAESIESNAAYWGGRDRVPRRAITAGMRVLLGARQTLLLVSGPNKQRILEQILHGPVSADVPASYLRTIQRVHIVADRAALGTPPPPSTHPNPPTDTPGSGSRA